MFTDKSPSPNNNTTTGAPGEKSALRVSPGRVPTIARPDAPGMTGKMSMPMATPASLKVGTVCCTGGGNAAGQITNGTGDPFAHLGHFRGASVLKRGHNQGAPGMPTTESPGFATPATPMAKESPGFATPAAPVGAAGGTMTMSPGARQRPVFNPTTNPLAAARQENRANRQEAKMGGGNMGAVRAENRANIQGARIARQTRNAQGFGASDRAALQAAKSAARTPAATPGSAARAQLGSAIKDVRSARQGLRSAIRGGDVSGAGNAFGALQSARGERKSARQNVRSVKRASRPTM